MILNQKIAIDIGASRIRYSAVNENQLSDEAALVVYRSDNNAAVAIGNDALPMAGRVSSELKLVYPIQQGNIVDALALQYLFAYVLHKWSKRFSRTTIMLSIGLEMSSVGRKILTDACYKAGAYKVYCMQQPIAAAIGAQIPIAEPKGHMICVLGASSCDFSIISLGQTVVARSIAYGGNDIDTLIYRYLHDAHNLSISSDTLREIKHKGVRSVTGKEKGSKKTIVLADDEYNGLFNGFFQKTIDEMHALFAEASPELVTDIMEQGIVICGGLALMPGLREYLSNQLTVPVYVSDNPDKTVITGLKITLDHLDEYVNSL